LSKPKAVNARKFHKPRNTDVKIIIQEQIETILDAFPIVRATQTQTNDTRPRRLRNSGNSVLRALVDVRFYQRITDPILYRIRDGVGFIMNE
jgi:hypothetical protein